MNADLRSEILGPWIEQITKKISYREDELERLRANIETIRVSISRREDDLEDLRDLEDRLREVASRRGLFSDGLTLAAIRGVEGDMCGAVYTPTSRQWSKDRVCSLRRHTNVLVHVELDEDGQVIERWA